MELQETLDLFEKFNIEIDQDGNPSGDVDGQKISNLGDLKEMDIQKRNKAFLMAAVRYLQKNQGYDEKAMKKPGGGWQNIISTLAAPPDIAWDGTLEGVVQINFEPFKSGSQAGKSMQPIKIRATDLIKYMKPEEKALFAKKEI